MRNTAVLLLLISAGCSSTPAAVRVVDLSHAYDENTVYWPTADGFRMQVDFKGETPGGWWYEANTITTAEHGGTHLDAPVHFAEGRWSADEIPLEKLIGPGVVIDVREACARDRDHLVTADELVRWEREHGRIPSGAIVLIDTGFARFWPDRGLYMGTAERGAEAVAKLHFPGLHQDAARWLVEERSVDAVGIDTPSIDRGQSKEFEAHRILFEANIPALENVAGMNDLPARGFELVALPMKIARGSGGPVRIAALIPVD